jgi:hypothetical protein
MGSDILNQKVYLRPATAVLLPKYLPLVSAYPEVLAVVAIPASVALKPLPKSLLRVKE